jgi:hypothetical protein
MGASERHKMSKYRTEDGTILDTSKAAQSWSETTDWDGNNRISRATGSQWNHQTLYLSSKGRYYLVHSSQWQGSLPHAEIVSNEAAAAWLVNNDREVPAELAALAEAVSE